MQQLFEQIGKYPSYNPLKPLEETTGIKVDNQEYLSLYELADCFRILADNVMKLDLNGFLIAYHIIMSPLEGLKESEVKLLTNEYHNLRQQSIKSN